MSTEAFTLPAGTYYVGDPCYAFSHQTDTWDKLLGLSDTFEKNVVDLDGKHVAGFGTMYGDGIYNGFPVDAGLIGCVHEDLIEDNSTFRSSPNCGRLVTFDEPFTVQGYPNGDIRIGHITVETGDDASDEDYDPDRDDNDFTGPW
ncbi:hypothetical protein FDI24_gp086 [Acidovorax phage ACP17]|uniref:Uncharacterized protein n=1 Tax=Acidovorax phage ACP17 TaxID=2010329 RepID=A0A218M2U2_9CAUD|nr:hypothetical protein FDI24_gp086 [Acidovorax phage ACP17]ASD50365.1 hypothetical protein [Acidovorax phage ACP17]